MVDEELLGTHRQELRRGTVVLACLLALRAPEYGYALLKRLEAAGIPSDANTIYPLLRRLEERGLLVSEWNTDDTRPRKFYRTSRAGDGARRAAHDRHDRPDGVPARPEWRTRAK